MQIQKKKKKRNTKNKYSIVKRNANKKITAHCERQDINTKFYSHSLSLPFSSFSFLFYKTSVGKQKYSV